MLAHEWRIPALMVFNRTGSTNDEARSRAARGAPAGTVVIAEEQTAGRGRSGAAWRAEPGTSLLLSIVLRPAPPTDAAAAFGALPLRAGLEAARAIREVTGVDAFFKWPNDLQAHGRKLAGILCEGALDADGGFVVCGVGINVHQEASDFPAELRTRATSLRALGRTDVDRVALAGAVVRGLLRAGAGLTALSPAELDELQSIDALRGHDVTIDGRPAGIAEGVAPDGALRVRNGKDVRAVYSGTVRLTSNP